MTSHTYFISDLHLSEEHPEITRAFLSFIQNQAHTADALYILGDFFETWVGDDLVTPLSQSVCNALKQLHQKGVAIYFMHGNRDFLIGQKFIKAAGMTLLNDPSPINLYGKDSVITHGDYLCTEDTSHQRFRRFTGNKLTQRCFFALPLKLRQRIAMALRNKSKQFHANATPDPRYDVTLPAVTQMMGQYRVQWMIHGHTHRPACHQLIANQLPAQRYVLGAWEAEAQIIRVESDQTAHFETLSIT